MTAIVEILKDIGSSESTSGAITIALVSAAIALTGWVLSKVWVGVENRLTRRRSRREAVTHLFVDALIRLHNLKKNFPEKERSRYLELMNNAEEGFRAYVEAYEERNISTEIGSHTSGR